VRQGSRNELKTNKGSPDRGGKKGRRRRIAGAPLDAIAREERHRRSDKIRVEVGRNQPHRKKTKRGEGNTNHPRPLQRSVQAKEGLETIVKNSKGRKASSEDRGLVMESCTIKRQRVTGSESPTAKGRARVRRVNFSGRPTQMPKKRERRRLTLLKGTRRRSA